MPEEPRSSREEWSSHQLTQAASVGGGWRLSFGARRLLLRLGDLFLINWALFMVEVFLAGLPLSIESLVGPLKWYVTLSLLWLLVASALNIYDLARTASTTYSVMDASLAAVLVSLGYSLIPWLTPPLDRRLLLFSFVGLAVASVSLWRVIYAQLLCRSAFERRVVVIGGDATVHRVVDELARAGDASRPNPFRGTGYRIVAQLEDLETISQGDFDPAHGLVRLLANSQADEVLVAEGSRLSPSLQEALLDIRELGMRVTPLSLAYERLSSRLPIEYAERDLNMVTTVHDSSTERLYSLVKRAMDLLLAVPGLLLMGLLMLLVSLGNALTSPGPLLRRQQRVGRGGRPLILFTFRTTRPGIDSDRDTSLGTRHEAITPMGRWLESTHVEKIPQILNVLLGSMSFVGPRPESPEFTGRIAREVPIYRARHCMRPGITGWGRIHYRPRETVADARVRLEYELYYIKHASLSLDTLILLQTIPFLLGWGGR